PQRHKSGETRRRCQTRQVGGTGDRAEDEDPHLVWALPANHNDGSHFGCLPGGLQLSASASACAALCSAAKCASTSAFPPATAVLTAAWIAVTPTLPPPALMTSASA